MKKGQLKKLEGIAKEFNYQGSDNYLGAEGEFEFAGKIEEGQTFVTEHSKGLIYGFRLKNTFGEAKTIAFCPAYFDTLARLQAAGHADVDAILGDGDILVDGVDADLKVTATAINTQSPIFGLLAFTKRNPARVTHMTLQSTKIEQFDEQITVKNVSPFDDQSSKTIRLTDYFSPAQNQDKKIVANLIGTGNVLDFNDQNIIKFRISAGADLVINFDFGGIYNAARKLDNKANRAHRNIARKNPDLYRG